MNLGPPLVNRVNSQDVGWKQAGTHRTCLHLSIIESRYNDHSSSHLPNLVKVFLISPYLIHIRGFWQGVSQLSQLITVQTTTLTFITHLSPASQSSLWAQNVPFPLQFLLIPLVNDWELEQMHILISTLINRHLDDLLVSLPFMHLHFLNAGLFSFILFELISYY